MGTATAEEKQIDLATRLHAALGESVQVGDLRYTVSRVANEIKFVVQGDVDRDSRVTYASAKIRGWRDFATGRAPLTGESQFSPFDTRPRDAEWVTHQISRAIDAAFTSVSDGLTSDEYRELSRPSEARR